MRVGSGRLRATSSLPRPVSAPLTAVKPPNGTSQLLFLPPYRPPNGTSQLLFLPPYRPPKETLDKGLNKGSAPF